MNSWVSMWHLPAPAATQVLLALGIVFYAVYGWRTRKRRKQAHTHKHVGTVFSDFVETTYPQQCQEHYTARIDGGAPIRIRCALPVGHLTDGVPHHGLFHWHDHDEPAKPEAVS